MSIYSVVFLATIATVLDRLEMPHAKDTELCRNGFFQEPRQECQCACIRWSGSQCPWTCVCPVNPSVCPVNPDDTLGKTIHRPENLVDLTQKYMTKSLMPLFHGTIPSRQTEQGDSSVDLLAFDLAENTFRPPLTRQDILGEMYTGCYDHHPLKDVVPIDEQKVPSRHVRDPSKEQAYAPMRSPTQDVLARDLEEYTKTFPPACTGSTSMDEATKHVDLEYPTWWCLQSLLQTERTHPSPEWPCISPPCMLKPKKETPKEHQFT